MPADEPVLVVGGGIGGLVLARRLALGGRRVTVLEASDRWGGQLARHHVAGIDLDAAAESFATRGGVVATLLDELGLAQEVVLPATGPAWLHRADGTAVPLPATGLLGIPGDPAAADVVRAVGRRASWRARLDTVLPAAVGSDASSLGDLVRRRMGRGVLDGLVAPVVRGVHSRDPGALPVEAASPRLRTELRAQGSLAGAVRALRAAAPAGSAVAGLRGGLFRVVDALTDACASLGVTLRTGVRVERVWPTQVAAGGRTYRGQVVLAAPDPIPGTGADRAAGAGGATYGRPAAPGAGARRLTLVTLVVAAPGLDAAPRGTGLLVAAGAPNVRARALTHVSAKWSWVAAALPGLHVLRLSYDGTLDDSPAAVRARAVADAQVLLATVVERVVDDAVGRWARPVGGVLGTRDDGLPMVGETAAGTGLAAVVDHAERTARALLGR